MAEVTETAKFAKQTKINQKSANMAVRPRVLAHRGVVEASGFVFALAMIEEAAARRRILGLWVQGASVVRVVEELEDNRLIKSRLERPAANRPADGRFAQSTPSEAYNEMLVLRLPTPVRVDCAFVPGMPLVLLHGMLAAMPLSETEARRLNAPAGSVVMARGGAAGVLPVENGRVEDPADWLDTSAWEWTQPDTLGLPPAPVRDIAARQEFDARARLAKVAGEDPARQSAIEALRKAALRKRDGSGGNGAGAGQAGKGGAAGSSSPFGNWLSRLFGQNGTAGGSASAGAGQAPAAAAGRNSLQDGFNRLAAHLAMLTGLSKLIGRKQAEYLKRMMDMFERGDWDQALRHAIGFSDLEGGDLPPALRAPIPRADLTISPQMTPISGGIGLPTEWTEHLRKLYREAFERLEQAGRIEEAAFVLAELLSAHEEAVQFLEKHGKLRLAAEIAEARNLPPGLIVRQWFVAGETERAVQIARRTGAFADAILRLERTQTDKLEPLHRHRIVSLRWLWAQSLADAGGYYQAVGVLKPTLNEFWLEEDRRTKLLQWLDKSVAMGGTVGAEALAYQFCLLNDRGDGEGAAKAHEQALALLEGEDEENAGARWAFARELLNGSAHPALQTLSRAVVRAVLRDAGMEFQTGMDAAGYARLLSFAGDAALRADAPPLPNPVAPPASPTSLLVFAFAVEDAGALPLSDAAFLPDGRCLVALGEMGVRLLTRDGRTVTHWDTPAHQFVMSDVGNRALVLARRGDRWQISRLDLTTRKLRAWGGAKLAAFAPDYDGSLWFASIDKDFLALDATAEDVAALWRLPNLEGRIQAITRSPKQCSFLLFAAGATDDWGKSVPLWTRLERWTHSLPDLMLRERSEVKPLPDAQGTTAEAASKQAIALSLSPLEDKFARSVAAEGDVFQCGVEPVGQTANAPLAPDSSASGSAWLATLTLPPITGNRATMTTAYSEQLKGSRPYPLPPLVAEKWIWLALRNAEGIEGRLLTRPQGTLKARFQLSGARQVHARFTPTHLTVADDKGRLLVLELDTLKLVRDLRVS